MDAYDSKTVSSIVGVSLRQLQYWDEKNFIRPSVKTAGGRGTKRLYSFHDLICLKVVKDLTFHGLSLQKIRRCLKSLKEHSSDTQWPSKSLRYLTDGEELFVITADRRKILDAMERQFVVSLGIGSLVRELDGRVRRGAPYFGRKRGRNMSRLEARRGGSA